jgi:hypothetical protein
MNEHGYENGRYVGPAEDPKVIAAAMREWAARVQQIGNGSVLAWADRLDPPVTP